MKNNSIKLIISEGYLNFAKENEIINFIDFAWLKNAFIIDYVAEGLIKAGYTNGTISTYDGYFKNLDNTSTYNYIINVIDNKSNDNPKVIGKYVTRDCVNVVQFRSFMYYSSDINNRFCEMNDDTYRHLYIDNEDGLCKSSVDSLTCYSTNLACAEIALSSMDMFISDAFVERKMNEIDFIWVDDTTIYYTDDIKLEGLHSSYIGEIK